MSDAPIAVIGAGPAGLIAAEVLSAADRRVVVFERMPSVARKFLMAGRGGLNLTHSESFEQFIARYGAAREKLAPMLEAFDASTEVPAKLDLEPTKASPAKKPKDEPAPSPAVQVATASVKSLKGMF